MKILNFGSLNIDNVYNVEHFVLPGETISSDKLYINCGGKGLNQSIALSYAGMNVYHAGAVGEDGNILIEALKKANVKTDYIEKIKGKSGHAIIQVNSKGQNCIILYGGSNQSISTEHIEKTIDEFGSGDILVLQNEINNNKIIIDKAKERGMKVVLNPSPFNKKIMELPLEKIDYFLINEVEGTQFTGENIPERILLSMHNKYENACILLTLGEDGCMCWYNGKIYKHSIFKTNVVDTTAAGDTFTGYFIKMISESNDVNSALKIASIASAIAVSRRGAAASIPTIEEVLDYEKEIF